MNESAVATNQRLFALGKDFGVAVAAAIQSGQEADARRVRDAYNGLVGEIDKAIADVGRWNTSGIDGAEDFKSALTRFYQGQKYMQENHFKTVVETLENKGLSREQRLKEVQTALMSAAAREQQDVGALQAAQKAFASKHGVKQVGGGGVGTAD
jgi:hypothetical protein